MTPIELARESISNLKFSPNMKILEPSFGTGNFIIAIAEKYLESNSKPSKESALKHFFAEVISGSELDSELYKLALKNIEQYFHIKLENHKLVNAEFFSNYSGKKDIFDFVIGNPPYGGTFPILLEDNLDKMYGKWGTRKLKKETYSFFIAASLDLLKEKGKLVFISSDSFLTIPTMSGLRRRLMDQTSISVNNIKVFSEETTQKTLVLSAQKEVGSKQIIIDGLAVSHEMVEKTPSLSWNITSKVERFFGGPTLGDYVIASSGMTIGGNDFFVREIDNMHISEIYDFELYDAPINLDEEISLARLNKLSPTKIEQIKRSIDLGLTKKKVRFKLLETPISIKLPNPNYKFYNKASSKLVFEEPKWAVYWKNEGEAIFAHKKSGPWYLHGVGGLKFFGKKGFTWPLVSQKLNVRYLPEGYILDSGAPVAILKPGIDDDEFWFIFAWCMTELATDLLKGVINHTRNIQSKDVERLPYPFWVSPKNRSIVVSQIKSMLDDALKGKQFTRDCLEIQKLNTIFHDESAEFNNFPANSIIGKDTQLTIV